MNEPMNESMCELSSPTMPEINLNQLAKKAGYPVEAFLFVQRGLDYTVRRLHGAPSEGPGFEDEDPATSSRHVSGRQLCHGLREFAVSEYGLLARVVLNRWKVRGSEDFGRIVFAMVESGIMHKTDRDSMDDFANVFTLDDAFAKPGGGDAIQLS